jgi:hypothetical protein
MPLDNTAHVPEPVQEDPFDAHNALPSPIFFPVAERLVGWRTRKETYEPIKTHKAIIRTTPEGDSVRVLDVVGSGYKLIHNKELFAAVENTMRKQIPASDLQGVQIKDRVAGWGRMCYREYVFPKIRCNLGSRARSDIAFRIIVQNGYGGSALRSHSGAIDFFCTNGMITGDYHSTYNKHTSGLVLSGIDATIERAIESFATNQTRWGKWTETPVKHQAAMDLFKELASSAKLQDNLAAQYLHERDARGDNLWAVYSTLTYYASHAEGDFKLRASTTDQDSAASTMLGRELRVAQWTATPAWKKLEAVT